MKKDIKLTYLKKAKKFLDKNSTVSENEIDSLIIKFIKKRFYNIDENIDFKKTTRKFY